MKITQILKHRSQELYALGLKLIFIYAEHSGPTLFASLINLCIAKVPESIKRIKALIDREKDFTPPNVLAGKNLKFQPSNSH
jgi:hypothetical protein